MVNVAKLQIVLRSEEKIRHGQLKDLKRYLGFSETLGDDLVITEEARMPGTCEWFSAKDSYLKWSSFDTEVPNILCITGRPAAGKSVLAGYVIGQLQKSHADCSYFFFKYGDKSKSRLSTCLRSLAFQMASLNTKVRETLVDMEKNGTNLDHDNERTIWRTLFLGGIFQTGISKHYWVIDALDECTNITSLFDPMLVKLDDSMPLRILFTSRQTPKLEKFF